MLKRLVLGLLALLVWPEAAPVAAAAAVPRAETDLVRRNRFLAHAEEAARRGHKGLAWMRRADAVFPVPDTLALRVGGIFCAHHYRRRRAAR